MKIGFVSVFLFSSSWLYKIDFCVSVWVVVSIILHVFLFGTIASQLAI